MSETTVHYCSFCSVSNLDAKLMVSEITTGAVICDKCILLCAEFCFERMSRSLGQGGDSDE